MTYQPCFLARSTLLAIALVAGARSASAQDPGPDTAQAPRIAVDLAGIDLATAEGLSVARRRIDGAARAVCASVIDLDGWHMQKSACVLAARDAANRQLAQLHDLALRSRKPVDYALKGN